MPKKLSTFGPDAQKMFQHMKRNLDKAMRACAATMETHYKGSFREGGFADTPSTKWKTRSKPDKNKKTRAVLVKSGDLRRSLQAKVTAPRTITLSSDVPYAEVHNEGGAINATQSVKAHTRTRVKQSQGIKSHTATRNGKSYTVNRKVKLYTLTTYAVKAHTRSINTTMPQRQFMPTPQGGTIGKPLEDKLYHILKDALDKPYEDLYGA
jgi:phage gpG-like protein